MAIRTPTPAERGTRLAGLVVLGTLAAGMTVVVLAVGRLVFDPVHRTPALRPPPATVSDQDAAAAAVTDAYGRFWDAYLAAGSDGAPFDPAAFAATFRPLTTPDEYERVFNGTQLARIEGQVFRGPPIDHRVAVAIDGPRRASVRDCQIDRGGVWSTRTGLWATPPGDGTPELFVTAMVREGGAWKVDAVTSAGPCAR